MIKTLILGILKLKFLQKELMNIQFIILELGILFEVTIYLELTLFSFPWIVILPSPLQKFLTVLI